MKRTDGYKLRQVPMCGWCFLPLLKSSQKFCSEFCSDAAIAWQNDAHWRKIGQEVARTDKKKHYEKTILGEEDYEFPVESDPT